MIALRFSDVRSDNLLGKYIRTPLKLIPDQIVLPILQGPAKGLKWIKGSSVNGIWLGSYEVDKQRLLAELPLKNTIALDIGANVGFFSLLLSRLVGPQGKVFAFEPLPRNCNFLQQHLKLNQIQNVILRATALSDEVGTLRFNTTQHNAQGFLDQSGDLAVEVSTLDSLDIDMNVSFIKIDVEGAEANVLQGGRRFFTQHRPTILLATHGEQAMKDCQDILADYNYSLRLVGEDLYQQGCDEWLATPNNSL